MQQKVKIGISHGDINGISYELIIKALLDPRMEELCTPLIFGSSKVLAYHKKALEIDNFSAMSINSASEAKGGKAYVVNCVDDNVRVELGKNTQIAGISSYQALKSATDALKNGEIDALVTGPINKQNIQHGDFHYKGHTEYLQNRFEVDEVMMLMVSDLMKVGLVAAHLPIAQLSSFISTRLIVKKLSILSHSLLVDFGIRSPRIAVLGLNPHAGDDGLLGNEEKEVIIPAIEEARKLKILAFGPYPADGFFGAGRFKQFDAVLAMYHDQGLAPFKALVMDGGVNFTAGLPVVRTSPAHGTAFDLAGKNMASIDSFRNAIYTAIDVVRNRNMHEEISRNPMGTEQPRHHGRDESPEDMEADLGK